MDLEQQIAKNITDLDLNRYFPETKTDNHHVIKYSELADVKSIYDLLPKDMTYKIILIEEQPNKGHWVCILRYGRTIEAFDSYSGTIDNELKYIPEVMKRILGEDKSHLGRLVLVLPPTVLVLQYIAIILSVQYLSQQYYCSSTPATITIHNIL